MNLCIYVFVYLSNSCIEGWGGDKVEQPGGFLLSSIVSQDRLIITKSPRRALLFVHNHDADVVYWCICVFLYLSICVFVYLCVCICIFVYFLLYSIVVQDCLIITKSPMRALPFVHNHNDNVVYSCFLCICVSVYLCFCVFPLVIYCLSRSLYLHQITSKLNPQWIVLLSDDDDNNYDDDDDDNYDDDHNHHVSASCSQSSHPFLLLPHFMSYLFFNPIQSDTLGKW